MEATQSKRTIYLIIISSILGLFFVIYWMFGTSSDITTRDNQDEIITDTNNIINTTDELPIKCSQTLTLLNCMISSPQLSVDKEGINQYYQKLISERNIITDTTLLEGECAKQYNYIQGLQETGYQQIIQSCSK